MAYCAETRSAPKQGRQRWVRLVCSCSSDWQPFCGQREQDFPCPVAPRDWQGEWTASGSQFEEQAQLLWALSDQAVPRYRKVPPSQPKASVPVKKRPDKEVKLSAPPEQDKGPLLSPAKAKPAPAQPQELRSEGKEGRHQDDSADEHYPRLGPLHTQKSVRSSRSRLLSLQKGSIPPDTSVWQQRHPRSRKVT